MGLGLYKKRFDIHLETQSVPDVIGRIKQYENTVLESIQLRTRINEDGSSLRMKFLVSGRYTPPKLKGRITEEYGKMSLQGIIKESLVEGFTYWIFLFLSIFMALVTVVFVVDSFNWVPILICGGGALVFALIAYWLGKLRRINFNMDQALLMECMEQIIFPFISKDNVRGTQRGEEEL